MEHIFELLKNPVVTLASMIIGVPLFTFGASSMGVVLNTALDTGVTIDSGFITAIAVTIIGFVALSFGFVGITQNVIERELESKGLM